MNSKESQSSSNVRVIWGVVLKSTPTLKGMLTSIKPLRVASFYAKNDLSIVIGARIEEMLSQARGRVDAEKEKSWDERHSTGLKNKLTWATLFCPGKPLSP